jgi:fatty-acyl-CoA synthase
VHIVLSQEDGSEQTITYGALQDRAFRVAAGLRARGLPRRASVALMLRTEADFFPAFFGPLLAGRVPVPIYPPVRLDRIEEYARRHVGILRNAEARELVTFSEAARVMGLIGARVPSLTEVTTVAALADSEPELPGIQLAPDDASVIQYTSGSTAEPKGVLLTHANLLANIRAIGQAIALQPDDVAVSWLPLYHDMGLIGSWLAALYFGMPIVILSPLAFLARPARWLWAVHAHRGTLSAVPNFAFELCVRKITDEEIRGLDLSAWRLAFNGAEPVRHETIERFTRRFAPYGFRPEAMCPVYGLAEAAAALTVSPVARHLWCDHVVREAFQRTQEARPAPPGDPTALRFVSCGRPVSEHEVRVVDGRGRPVDERVEGRIVFRGPSVTVGYVRNPEATRAAVHDGWWDSGDLGYQAKDELFITGRRKDMIIKGGRNIYPQEVEETAGRVPGIRTGCVAAFAVADPRFGSERLVVVAESRETSPAVRARLQAAVIDHVVAMVGIPPDAVVIAGPGAVRKTSSGKVRRSATREAYLAGRLERHRAAWAQWAWLLLTSPAVRMRRVADRLLEFGYTGYVGALLALTLPVLWVLVHLSRRGQPVHRLVRTWCRVVLALGGCPVQVVGFESLGGTGPAAANHASYVDALVLVAVLPPGCRFVAKRELADAPLIGSVLRKGGHLVVGRADLSRSVADAERVTAALRGGVSPVVFPSVAPGGILGGHPHKQGRDLLHDPWTAWPRRRERPLPGDQRPVPSQDRVGRHDGRDLPQDPSTEAVALRGEASALVIGQPEAAPLQLPLEDAVFFDQVFDDVLLVAIDPSGEGHEQHLQAGDIGRHGPIVPCLIPDPVTGSGPAEFSDTTGTGLVPRPGRRCIDNVHRRGETDSGCLGSPASSGTMRTSRTLNVTRCHRMRWKKRW